MEQVKRKSPPLLFYRIMKAKILAKLYVMVRKLSRYAIVLLARELLRIIRSKDDMIKPLQVKEEKNQKDYQVAIDKVANKHNAVTIKNLVEIQNIEKRMNELQDLL